jgi:cold-inducible RNA-binding protein
MKKIYVGNLSYSVQKQDLKEAFSKWQLEDCIVIESKGFGFVTFASEEDALQAKEELNNFEFQGRQMKLDFAKERTDSKNRGDFRSSRGGKRNDFKKRY